MAEWRIPIEHLLEFANEEEATYYQSPERTEAERNELRSELEEVYQSISDPTDAELKQFMGERNWQETERNPSSRDLSRAQWKGFRKAEARKRLAESKRQSSEPKTKTLGGTDEMWWGHFYVSHLSQEERNRIKRGEFQPEEIKKLAKGEDPWDWHKPLPAGLEPPADAPPFEAWLQKVIEHFSPVAERVRQAAVDAAKGVPESSETEADKPATESPARKGPTDLYELSKRTDLPPADPKAVSAFTDEIKTIKERAEKTARALADMAREAQSPEAHGFFQPILQRKPETLANDPVPVIDPHQDTGTPSTFSVRVQRGSLAVIALLAAWLFEQVHAPVALAVVTVIVCVLSLVGVRWLEKTPRRRNLFIVFLVLYALGALIVLVVTRTSSTSPIPSNPASQPQVTSKSEEAVDVDPAYLVGLYQKYNSAQADELVKSYIGKWTPPISGTVSDVTGDQKSALMTIAVKSNDGTLLYVIAASFNEEKWATRALLYRRNESVAVKGKLEHVRWGGILLIDCEITE